MWSFERFDIGRPTLASYEAYEDLHYAFDEVGVPDELDAPTMGTLWVSRDVSILSILFAHLCSNSTFIVDQVCSLQPRGATGTGRGTYNVYANVLDQRTPNRVQWTRT